MAALIGGSLNVTSVSVAGLIAAHAKGIPFQMLAPGGMYVSEQPAEMLVVRKDAPIHSGADLNGKTVASSALGDIDSVAVSAWIDQHGGDSRTVRHLEIPPPAIPAAIEAGRIDAAGLQEPALSLALRGGNLRGIGKAYDAIAKRFLVSMTIVMADFASANREVIVRFLRAQLEANAFANTHHDQTAIWLAEAANVDVATIVHTPRKILAESLDPAMIQPVIDASVRYKVIEKAFDPRDLISPAILSLL
jgi:NitT/TauT family transport system substrate-binding protein